jgi:hypothetical protein
MSIEHMRVISATKNGSYIKGVISGFVIGIIIILSLFGINWIISFNKSKGSDRFNNHQIQQIAVFQMKEIKYSLALELSGFQDKVEFIQVYNEDISSFLNTEKVYINPVYSELIKARMNYLEYKKLNIDENKKEITITFKNDVCLFIKI